MSQAGISQETEWFLEDLVEELTVSPTRYEQAERSYKSLGEWLHRDDSTVRRFDPQVYVQGSFRLGTVIRPANEDEEYDVDSVCELRSLTKLTLTQKQLKDMLGWEIEAYRKSKRMDKPLREGRRCWVLSYADEAQFHMDIVPAVPNATDTHRVLANFNLETRWTTTAIAITDNEVPNYKLVSSDWPRSNPKGYSEWFKSRMESILQRRKQAVAKAIRANVEDLPDYRVQTPLQAAVMILKRHRDHMFLDRPEVRPISVIITTLAGHAYQGEESIGGALERILTDMDRYILTFEGKKYIPNPSDPLENFADKWEKHPERQEAFYEWLAAAREQFMAASKLTIRTQIHRALSKGMGVGLTERALRRRGGPSSSLLRSATVAPASSGLSFPDRGRIPAKPQGFAAT